MTYRARLHYLNEVTDTLFSVLLAFGGYSILNIAQAVQKIGLQARAAAIEENRRPVFGNAMWFGALIASAASFVLVFAAIATGRVAVVGAMAGTGLASLALFSRIVMREHLGSARLIAISAIIGGAALVALAPAGSAAAASSTVREPLLWAVPLGAVILGGTGIAIISANQMRGLAIAGLSGFLGAWSQLVQKRATMNGISSDLSARVVEMVAHPITLAWVGLSFASLVIIQFSYRHAQAIRIIPVYTALFIVTPVVGGLIVFGERLSPLQWIGVAVIAGGAARLTTAHAPMANATSNANADAAAERHP